MLGELVVTSVLVFTSPLHLELLTDMGNISQKEINGQSESGQTPDAQEHAWNPPELTVTRSGEILVEFHPVRIEFGRRPTR
jgi:hypothetical protein